MLAGVPEEYRAFIDDLQPFNAPEPTEDRLAVLQAFSNIDKHKLIHAAYLPPSVDVSLTPTNFPPTECEIEYSPGGPIEQGAELFRFRPRGRIQVDMDVDKPSIWVEQPFEIALGPGLVRIPELHGIWVYVLRIVATIEAFLERPDGLPDPAHDVAALRDPDVERWLRG